MRPGEECPYITPCGMCTVFDTPCEDVVEDYKKEKRKRRNKLEQKRDNRVSEQPSHIR